MERLSPRKLQRYLDGELGRREHRRVEAHLAACPDDRAAVERMHALGSLIRESGREMQEGVSFNGFAARVMDGVRRQRRPGAMERLGVWLGEFLEHRRRVWIPAAAVAGAAAAVLLALPLVGGAPEIAPVVAGDTRIAVFGHAGDEAAPGGSEIVSVTGAPGWRPYQVTNEQGESMAVAWIGE